MKPSAPPFLSLKWKALLLTSLVLMIVTASFAGFNYLEMRRQFQERGDIAHQLYTQQVEGLITQSSARLRQLSTMIASLPEIREPLTDQNSQQLASAFERLWPGLALDMGIEEAAIYNLSEQVLFEHGIPRTETSKMRLEATITEVIHKEQPITLRDCSKTCMELAIAPILGTKNTAGAILLGTSLADVVLGFQGLSATDMGLIVASPTEHLSTEARWLPNWQVRVEALTHSQHNLEILQQAAAQYSLSDIARTSVYIPFKNRAYEIRLVPLTGFEQAVHMLVVADITDAISRIRATTHRNIGLGVIGLISSGALLLTILWTPMSRLRRAADNLPLLAKGHFEKIRSTLSKTPRKGVLQDEIHILEDTTIQLSHRLEALQQEVAERTQTLSKRMEELSQERDFVTQMLDTAQVIILTQEEAHGIVISNRYAETLTGYTEHDLQGRPFSTLIAQEEAIPHVLHRLTELFAGQRERLRQDTELSCKDGSTRNIIWHHSRLSGPEPATILSVGLDITERKQAELRLSWLADHDPLTGLFNRRRFQEELLEAVAIAKRYRHSGTLLFLDLDQFKYINDTSGHQAGDHLLQKIAKTLPQVLREVDVIGRLGGDEFAIILRQTTAKEAEMVADNLLKNLGKVEISVAGRQHKILASIGIAVFPEHGSSVHDLLAVADLAMYQAKDSGRGGWHVFSPQDQSLQRMQERVLWKERVEHTLTEKQFLLYFQPILDIRKGTISRYEVLFRALDEGGNIILPTRFIQVAEREGLIHTLDRIVLAEAITYQAALLARGHEVTFAVNLSAHAFQDTQLLPHLQRLLQESSLEPQKLVLEITETAAVADFSAAIDLMVAIKELGCQFALDDFGVGFSSFHHLQQLPVDIVKIDGSFIRSLPERKNDRVLVNAINQIAQGFGKKTVAEFVEDADTLKCLEDLKVDFAQGYYVGHPAPASTAFGE